MSTKMSADLNLTRPSTRLHAPPGGGSTISLGYDQPVKSASVVVQKSSVVLEPVTEKLPYKVTIIAALNGTTDILPLLVKALAGVGLVQVAVAETASVLSTPYLAQALVGSTDGILAAGIGSNVMCQTVTAALLQTGLTGHLPVIPAIVEATSLLEAKVLFADQANSWAHSLLSLLKVKNDKRSLVLTAPPAVGVSYKPIDVAKQTSVDGLLAAFRVSLKSHGANGIFGIARKFRIMDDDNSKSVDLEEFKKAIAEHALGWTAAQVKQVFDYFDHDHSGGLSYEEFLRGARDPLNDRRKQFILQAFEILDTDKSGFVDASDLRSKYDTSKHPAVLSGRLTHEQVLKEFLETFEGSVKDGKVTPEEFIEYYTDVSASIDDDDYFELMMRNAWHISGGEGWCANSSNRRVLVIHNDGRQTVEEIKNDLGITRFDYDAMVANLKAQGIDDIHCISTSGSTADSESDLPTPPPVAHAAAAGKQKTNPGLQSSIFFG